MIRWTELPIKGVRKFYQLKLNTQIKIVVLLIIGFSWGNTGIIFAKAHLANFLIANAWDKRLKDNNIHRPWSWSDTWPVAKLYFPKHRKTRYVLANANGESLAFGATMTLGETDDSQTRVINGHRDTHFSFLEDAEVGDIFLYQGLNGKTVYYRLEESRVTNIHDGPMIVNTERNEIQLVTCYPFNAVVPGGPLRYILVARPLIEGKHHDTSPIGPNKTSSIDHKHTRDKPNIISI